MARVDVCALVRGDKRVELTSHGRVNPANIGEERDHGELVAEVGSFSDFISRRLRAARRVDQCVNIEVAEGDLGTGGITAYSGVRIGEDSVFVGEDGV